MQATIIIAVVGRATERSEEGGGWVRYVVAGCNAVAGCVMRWVGACGGWVCYDDVQNKAVDGCVVIISFLIFCLLYFSVLYFLCFVINC